MCCRGRRSDDSDGDGGEAVKPTQPQAPHVPPVINSMISLHPAGSKENTSETSTGNSNTAGGSSAEASHGQEPLKEQ